MVALKPTFSELDIPVGAAITCKLVGLQFDWGKSTYFYLDDSVSLTNSHSISRHVARLHPTLDLYPSNILHRTEVDHWLTLASGPMCCKNEISSVLCQLNRALAPSVFLTADTFTIADIEIFASLYKSNEWLQKVQNKTAPAHVLRWYNHVFKKVEKILSTIPTVVVPSNGSKNVINDAGKKRDEGGKFVELPDAKMREVVVRFPPEASGYLHIGHAKAALLNQYYQKAFEGKLIMRFDDTNPAKEDAEFEKVILEDLKLLQIEPDIFTHTSDYFDQMLGMCENLIKEGKAYADDTDPETMKKERDERKESKNRSNSVQKNIKMWTEMKNGSEYGQSCCIRAKIDMNSPNGCMRDPTIYRCKNEPHIRTGYKYKVYPTYDFACPIVDSVEGVTHALRTTEYHDRDDQYYWFIKTLNLRNLHIYEYSRLNMNNTVLSKRKLTWFVKEGLVDGWDDPRFPTVRGILRRGMTIEGLKNFIISQGSSRSVVNMEWDKIWAFNKKVIDQIAPRYTALQGSLIPVHVHNAKEENKLAQKHPRDASIGMKTIWMAPRILIEAEDAAQLKEGENSTFINWGNLKILKINKNNGDIIDIEAEANLSNTDYKKTLKLTWLAETKEASSTPVVAVYFDHLISKSVLGKDEEFKDFIPDNTRNEIQMIGDDELKQLKKGDIIQLQRKGFFRVDEEYKPFSVASCKETPVVLFYIPDGHLKENANVVSSKKVNGMSTKEINQSSKGKAAEKSPQEEANPLVASSGVADLLSKIKNQGDIIRSLKANKSDKALINPAVEQLKALKSQFKEVTGVEWKPDIDINQFEHKEPILQKIDEGLKTSSSITVVHDKIKSQGDKIRTLKTNKADKSIIISEVEILKTLKNEFKNMAGVEWKPEIDVKQFEHKEHILQKKDEGLKTTSSIANVHDKIKLQGDKIRTLKTNKADKSIIISEVEILKTLKNEFKNITGVEWKPEIDVNQYASSKSSEEIPLAPLNKSSTAVEINDKIKMQGDKIRSLKTNKADKTVINSEVEVLKALKSEFKVSTGVEWKAPEIAGSKPFLETGAGNLKANLTATEIHNKIKEQGDKIRALKAGKAEKSVIISEVELLKSLKSEFKDIAGVEWKPEIDINLFADSKKATTNLTIPNAPVKVKRTLSDDNHALVLLKKIKVQGDKIRNLKSVKAENAIIMHEVEFLKMLKTEFKDATGVEWMLDIDMNQFTKECSKTSSVSPTKESKSTNSSDALIVHEKIVDQGTKVRNLKNEKASQEIIKVEIDLLLKLKKEFQLVTGIDWKPDIDPSTLSGGYSAPSKSVAKKQKEHSPPKASAQEDASGKKQTRLGLEVKKEENFSAWYSQVITKSEMIEYYNVSGCYILRPWSYAIWDFIKSFFDTEIKKLGVENSYFPMFVAKEALEREKTHIADFSPEVAWVTRSGSSEMAEPVAIRPTSETVMYPAFAKWIQSHRDLPLKLNQWNNVVRWEFKQPTPFLRTREFLWQEGHTAFATRDEATQEVYTILDLYARVYEELLAIPVVRGKKTEKEKFAGGDFTTTTEAYIKSSGRAIQGATSHHLGQNFSKMFNIVFEDPKTLKEQFVFQNSWGLTTRTIGVMVMVHGDDKGLVLPPRIAVVQVIIMPVGITAKSSDADKEALIKSCEDLMSELVAGGIRARCDFKDNVTPAWKFNHWELKGVPIRIELGPREVAAGQVYTVRRDNGEKQSLSRTNIAALIYDSLENIQESMYQKALSELNEHKVVTTDWATFITNLEKGNLIIMPFCGNEECEDAIKKDSARDEPSEAGAPSMGAKGLCIPFKQPGSVDGIKCIHPKCSRKPQFYTLFGRSY